MVVSRRQVVQTCGMRRTICAAIALSASLSTAIAQTPTLLERLGYPPDAKLLIVHADDLGMAHSINAASTKAFESGLVTSGSIMVPCPWFPEIAQYARTHPDTDLGLHLTLTAEWRGFRWGPLLPASRVSTLLDKSGYLHPTETEAAAHIDPRQAEAEIRAQIARARAFGIRPTHLDSHMGTLYQSAALFKVLLRVAREARLPVRITKARVQEPFAAGVLQAGDIVIDRVISIDADVPPERWAEFYTNALETLEPGVTEIVVHLAYDDEEMRAISADHPHWGSAWRQRDFDFVTSAAFREVIEKNNIQLITWRRLAALGR
jgi:predicted glycoside hydrolase/deacetylase ChbG (UPF0249 family)